MVERDDEDMWFECFGWACDFVSGNSRAEKFKQATELANVLYDACKAKTRRAQAEKPKLVPQLKS